MAHTIALLKGDVALSRRRRRSMRIAIVGGGIGGMTLALSLLDAGIDDVDIYESTSAVKELGVGINVLPHAVRELTELGLLEALYRIGIPTAEVVFYSKHGQRIWGEPQGLAAGYRWPQISVQRGRTGPHKRSSMPGSWPESQRCSSRSRRPSPGTTHCAAQRPLWSCRPTTRGSGAMPGHRRATRPRWVLKP
jgi:hypothetical protein